VEFEHKEAQLVFVCEAEDMGLLLLLLLLAMRCVSV